MKATGVVRRVDEIGRLVIPKEIREVRGIEHGTPMEFFIDNENIIIRKYQSNHTCFECGEVKEELLGKKVLLCRSCVTKLLQKGK